MSRAHNLTTTQLQTRIRDRQWLLVTVTLGSTLHELVLTDLRVLREALATPKPVIRTAVVHTDRPIANYLPKRYRVTNVVDGKTYIEGTDFHGWTLDGYVIPRLSSGMFRCVETTQG
jgi:hypothetical protein